MSTNEPRPARLISQKKHKEKKGKGQELLRQKPEEFKSH